MIRDMPPKVEGEDKLFEYNQKLVWLVISRKFSHVPLEAEDLFQIGAVGLTRAIRTYDEKRGTFSTHATREISHEICREIVHVMRKKRTPKLKTVSMDAKQWQIDDGKPFYPLDVADPTQDIEAAFIIQDNLNRAFAVLSPRERHVIKGLFEGNTMDDLAKDEGVSRQRIQQIAEKARLKMAAVYER